MQHIPSTKYYTYWDRDGTLCACCISYISIHTMSQSIFSFLTLIHTHTLFPSISAFLPLSMFVVLTIRFICLCNASACSCNRIVFIVNPVNSTRLTTQPFLRCIRFNYSLTPGWLDGWHMQCAFSDPDQLNRFQSIQGRIYKTPTTTVTNNIKGKE